LKTDSKKSAYSKADGRSGKRPQARSNRDHGDDLRFLIPDFRSQISDSKFDDGSKIWDLGYGI